MSNSRYKAIGFDYGGVIGNSLKDGDIRKKVCELLDITNEEYSRIYFSLNNLPNLGELDDWQEFWCRFLKEAGKDESHLGQITSWNQEMENALKIVDTRVIDLIDQLRANDYKTGLLSNTTITGAKNMRELGIPAHFDVFHASSETKLMKPNPEAFGLFAKDLGVELSDLIFVDDTPNSLRTSEECGFMPILFVGYDQLITKLNGLGIL